MCTYTYLKINMFFDCVPISWLRPLFQAFSAISYPKNKPVDTDRAIYKTFDAANISDIICSTACIVQCACCINLDWFSFDTSSTIQKIPKRRSGGKVCLRKEWQKGGNSPRSWGKNLDFPRREWQLARALVAQLIIEFRYIYKCLHEYLLSTRMFKYWTHRQGPGTLLELRVAWQHVEPFPHEEDDVVVLLLIDRIHMINIAGQSVPKGS